MGCTVVTKCDVENLDKLEVLTLLSQALSYEASRLYHEYGTDEPIPNGLVPLWYKEAYDYFHANGIEIEDQ